MKITCLKELKKRKTLKFDDTVEFTVKEKTISYKVLTHFLSNINDNGPGNNKIFRILDLKKKKLAEKVYGYKVYGGNWPNSEENDYDALTRLVERIYEIVEEKYPKKIIEMIEVTRFEIMDL